MYFEFWYAINPSVSHQAATPSENSAIKIHVFTLTTANNSCLFEYGNEYIFTSQASKRTRSE